jgi:hypothetical protein
MEFVEHHGAVSARRLPAIPESPIGGESGWRPPNNPPEAAEATQPMRQYRSTHSEGRNKCLHNQRPNGSLEFVLLRVVELFGSWPLSRPRSRGGRDRLRRSKELIAP